MKKSKFLFLLVPSLFLMTSCQTTPHVDTIDEVEAQKFIQEHYQEVNPVDPKTSSKMNWKITEGSNTNDAKKIVSAYFKNVPVTSEEELNAFPLEGKNQNLEEGRGAKYLLELSSEEPHAMDLPGTDAVVAMNEGIYNKLYHSDQNLPTVTHLTYKHGPDNGLIIISESFSQKSVHRRTHTYNHLGLESQYKVEMNKDGAIFSLTIDFTY